MSNDRPTLTHYVVQARRCGTMGWFTVAGRAFDNYHDAEFVAHGWVWHSLHPLEMRVVMMGGKG